MSCMKHPKPDKLVVTDGMPIYNGEVQALATTIEITSSHER